MLKLAQRRLTGIAPTVGGRTFLNTQQADVRVPAFGSAAAKKRRGDQQNTTSGTTATTIGGSVIGLPTTLHGETPPTNSIEEESWASVSREYKFRIKPKFYCWTQFLSELRRYDLSWRNGSASQMVFVLTLLDYGPGVAEQLFALRSEAAKSHAISLLFETSVACYTKDLRNFAIPFEDECNNRKELQCELFVPGIVAANKTTTGKHNKYLQLLELDNIANEGTKNDTKKKEAAVPLAAVGTQATNPNDCIIKGKTYSKNSGERTDEQLVFQMSFQCYVHLITSALLVFLQQNDIGVPNYQLMERKQSDWVETHWRYLRHAACMHPLAWPIDPTSLPKG